MGVKSTQTITREQAIKRIREFRSQLFGHHDGLEQSSNNYLESELELLNDLLHDGEGFENYNIETVIKPITEGYERKGGINSEHSKVTDRPAPPAAIRKK